eukprot:TRINITY_DN39568_c0_g1_i2.p1 TRINITY_DN39568_c0_g1~~TRINITY_DN39568_c0_g1_i2.p1  ORF type:complete len:1691 (-),score=501.13 TRINITY_DN39568_c0_g1_i2:209-5281(-)
MLPARDADRPRAMAATVFRVTAAAAAAEREAAEAGQAMLLRLFPTSQALAPTEKLLTAWARTLSFGKSSTADVMLRDDLVSREHCYFDFDYMAGSITLVDCSTNGTFLNGHKVHQNRVRVTNGDQFLLKDPQNHPGEEYGYVITVHDGKDLARGWQKDLPTLQKLEGGQPPAPNYGADTPMVRTTIPGVVKSDVSMSEYMQPEQPAVDEVPPWRRGSSTLHATGALRSKMEPHMAIRGAMSGGLSSSDFEDYAPAAEDLDMGMAEPVESMDAEADAMVDGFFDDDVVDPGAPMESDWQPTVDPQQHAWQPEAASQQAAADAGAAVEPTWQADVETSAGGPEDTARVGEAPAMPVCETTTAQEEAMMPDDTGTPTAPAAADAPAATPKAEPWAEEPAAADAPAGAAVEAASAAGDVATADAKPPPDAGPAAERSTADDGDLSAKEALPVTEAEAADPAGHAGELASAAEGASAAEAAAAQKATTPATEGSQGSDADKPSHSEATPAEATAAEAKAAAAAAAAAAEAIAGEDLHPGTEGRLADEAAQPAAATPAEPQVEPDAEKGPAPAEARAEAPPSAKAETPVAKARPVRVAVPVRAKVPPKPAPFVPSSAAPAASHLVRPAAIAEKPKQYGMTPAAKGSIMTKPASLQVPKAAAEASAGKAGGGIVAPSKRVVVPVNPARMQRPAKLAGSAGLRPPPPPGSAEEPICVDLEEELSAAWEAGLPRPRRMAPPTPKYLQQAPQQYRQMKPTAKPAQLRPSLPLPKGFSQTLGFPKAAAPARNSTGEPDVEEPGEVEETADSGEVDLSDPFGSWEDWRDWSSFQGQQMHHPEWQYHYAHLQQQLQQASEEDSARMLAGLPPAPWRKRPKLELASEAEAMGAGSMQSGGSMSSTAAPGTPPDVQAHPVSDTAEKKRLPMPKHYLQHSQQALDYATQQPQPASLQQAGAATAPQPQPLHPGVSQLPAMHMAATHQMQHAAGQFQQQAVWPGGAAAYASQYAAWQQPQPTDAAAQSAPLAQSPFASVAAAAPAGEPLMASPQWPSSSAAASGGSGEPSLAVQLARTMLNQLTQELAASAAGGPDLLPTGGGAMAAPAWLTPAPAPVQIPLSGDSSAAAIPLSADSATPQEQQQPQTPARAPKSAVSAAMPPAESPDTKSMVDLHKEVHELEQHIAAAEGVGGSGSADPEVLAAQVKLLEAKVAVAEAARELQNATAAPKKAQAAAGAAAATSEAAPVQADDVPAASSSVVVAGETGAAGTAAASRREEEDGGGVVLDLRRGGASSRAATAAAAGVGGGGDSDTDTTEGSGAENNDETRRRSERKARRKSDTMARVLDDLATWNSVILGEDMELVDDEEANAAAAGTPAKAPASAASSPAKPGVVAAAARHAAPSSSGPVDVPVTVPVTVPVSVPVPEPITVPVTVPVTMAAAAAPTPEPAAATAAATAAASHAAQFVAPVAPAWHAPADAADPATAFWASAAPVPVGAPVAFAPAPAAPEPQRHTAREPQLRNRPTMPERSSSSSSSSTSSESSPRRRSSSRRPPHGDTPRKAAAARAVLQIKAEEPPKKRLRGSSGRAKSSSTSARQSFAAELAETTQERRAANPGGAPTRFKAGDEVKAHLRTSKLRKSKAKFDGTVKAVGRDGTYWIRLLNGLEQNDVPETWIEHRDIAHKPAAPAPLNHYEDDLLEFGLIR